MLEFLKAAGWMHPREVTWTIDGLLEARLQGLGYGYTTMQLSSQTGEVP